MKGRTNTWTKVLGAIAAAGVSLAAQASPGNGIRLGGSEARLHPFFDLETRYDSNVTYSGEDAVGDLVLHFRPGLELKAPGDAAAFEFSGALDWAQYLGMNDGKSRPIPVDTKELSRMYAYARLAAAFNRNGMVAPRVDNDFERTVSTASLAAVAVPVVSNLNKLLLAVPWRPGGGALVLVANGEWIVETFEKYKDEPPVPLSDLAYDQYRAGGEVQWRFLPRTSGVLQGSYYRRAPNQANQAQNASGLDFFAGMTGLLTERVAATAKLGYGSSTANGFTTQTTTYEAKSYSAGLADLAVEWLPLDSLSLRVGYKRSIAIDPVLSIMLQQGVNGTVQLKFAENYAFRVGARWDSFVFQLQDGATTKFLTVDPTVEAKFGHWLSGAVGYAYSTRNAEWPSTSGTSQPSYSKNEVFLRLGVTY
ncbi:MAG TPA: hypothetical protein VF875_08870 [Anaeromyxobacter sp.]